MLDYPTVVSHDGRRMMKQSSRQRLRRLLMQKENPFSVFNFEKPEDADFKKAWALKNLRPLWKVANLSKGAKLKKAFQPSLVF